MAKSKSKKPSSRAVPKRAAKPAGNATARAKSVKPAAKSKTAKSNHGQLVPLAHLPVF